MTKFLNILSENITKLSRENVFCYAKEGGEGYTKKELCECYNILGGTRNYCCKAVADKELFHSLFEGLDMKEVAINRSKIIEDNKHLFKDSQWFNDNVEL